VLRGVVLDFDGVILESNEVKTDVFREIFSRFPEHVDAMMAFHHANAWASRFLKFNYLVFERLGRPGDVAMRDALVAEFSQRSLARVTGAPFVVGAEDFLRELSPRVPLFLASITPSADIVRTVEDRGIAKFFTAVYGCPPWNKVAAIGDVVRRLGCERNEIALIGDAPGDLQSADTAGIEFIWRRSSIPFDSPPSSGFSDLAEIAKFLRPRLV